MSTTSARRLRADELRQATIKARVEQSRRRGLGLLACTCHACNLLANIRAMVARGEIVRVQDVPGAPAHAAGDESTRH